MRTKFYWWWRDAKCWWAISRVDARECLLNVIREVVRNVLTKKQAKIF